MTIEWTEQTVPSRGTVRVVAALRAEVDRSGLPLNIPDELTVSDLADACYLLRLGRPSDFLRKVEGQ